MSKRAWLLPLFMVMAAAAFAQQSVEGYVYNDANGNGQRDRGERGVRDVPVSNGRDVVLTDSRGHYHLPLLDGYSVFPILPSDRTMSVGRVPCAKFMHSSLIVDGRCDFGLKRKKEKKSFTLNAIGDVQVGDYQELDYAARTLWPELLSTDSADVNLFLGDLVNNNLPLQGKLRDMMELLPSQTWTVLGNHDRDADSLWRRQTATYASTFGSDVYAFNEGRVHFIVLNNVFANGSRGYRGELREDELEFVKNDLRHVPADRLICLSMHIPLAMTKNRDALLRLLEGRGDVLAITAHLHRVMRFLYSAEGVSVHELGAGATCGFWWVGERDWEGVPAALQQGGTPRNYFVLDFHNTDYRLRCKAVGLDARRQMSIHITGIDTIDSHLRDLRDVPPYEALITVWGGCDSTEVRCRVDGGEWLVAEKAAIIDPNVARTREMNLTKAYPTAFSRRNPMRAKPSPQLWRLSLPESARRGAHVIEVRAADRYGFSASGRRAFVYE